jgi:hypothetical protein
VLDTLNYLIGKFDTRKPWNAGNSSKTYRVLRSTFKRRVSLSPGTAWCRMLSFTPLTLYPLEEPLRYALDWRLGGLDLLDVRKISCSCRETNLDSSDVQPVAVILTGYPKIGINHSLFFFVMVYYLLGISPASEY